MAGLMARWARWAGGGSVAVAAGRMTHRVEGSVSVGGSVSVAAGWMTGWVEGSVSVA